MIYGREDGEVLNPIAQERKSTVPLSTRGPRRRRSFEYTPALLGARQLICALDGSSHSASTKPFPLSSPNPLGTTIQL